MTYDNEMYCPSVDVCGWCGDSECDGIGCIASLNPDDASDHPAIELLHNWLRRGQLAEQMEHALAHAENRRCACDDANPHGIPRPVLA